MYGADDAPDATATTAELRPPRRPAGGAALPGASAGATVTDTVTPNSGTFPQLVTVTEVPSVAVGGTTAGAALGTADVGSAHEVDNEPDATGGHGRRRDPDGRHDQAVEGREGRRRGEGAGGGAELRAAERGGGDVGRAPTPRAAGGDAGRWGRRARPDRPEQVVGLLEGLPLGRQLGRRLVGEIWVVGGAGRGGRRCPGDGERLHPEQPVDRRPERRRRRRPEAMTWVNRDARSPSGGGDARLPAWVAWSEVARTAESSPCWRMPRAVAGTAVSGRDAAPAISDANRAPGAGRGLSDGSARAR